MTHCVLHHCPFPRSSYKLFNCSIRAGITACPPRDPCGRIETGPVPFIGLERVLLYFYFPGPGVCQLHAGYLSWTWWPFIRLPLQTQTLIPHHPFAAMVGMATTIKC